MPISVTCSCGKYYELSDQLAGKQARCQECRNVFSVPSTPQQSALPRPGNQAVPGTATPQQQVPQQQVPQQQVPQQQVPQQQVPQQQVPQQQVPQQQVPQQQVPQQQVPQQQVPQQQVPQQQVPQQQVPQQQVPQQQVPQQQVPQQQVPQQQVPQQQVPQQQVPQQQIPQQPMPMAQPLAAQQPFQQPAYPQGGYQNPAKAKSQKSNTVLYGIIGGGVLVVILVVAFSMMGGDKDKQNTAANNTESNSGNDGNRPSRDEQPNNGGTGGQPANGQTSSSQPSNSNLLKKLKVFTFTSMERPALISSKNGRFIGITEFKGDTTNISLVDLTKHDAQMVLHSYRGFKLASVSNNGQIIALQKEKEKQIKILERSNDRIIAEFDEFPRSGMVSFSADSQYVLVDNREDTMIFDVPSAKMVWGQEKQSRARSSRAKWSDDLGKAPSMTSGKFQSYDVSTGEKTELLDFSSPSRRPTGQAISANGKFGLVTYDTNFSCYDLTSKQKIFQRDFVRPGAIAIADNGSYALFSKSDSHEYKSHYSLVVVDGKKGETVDTITVGESLLTVLMATDGSSFTYLSEIDKNSFQVTLYETTSNRSYGQTNSGCFVDSVPTNQRFSAKYQNQPTANAHSTSGQNTNSNTANSNHQNSNSQPKPADLESDKKQFGVTLVSTLPKFPVRLGKLLLSDDGEVIVVQGGDYKFHSWSKATNKIVSFGNPSQINAKPLALRADGRIFVSEYQKVLYVWDTKTGKELAKYEDELGITPAIRFDSTGNRLDIVNESKTFVWDLKSKKVTQTKALTVDGDPFFRFVHRQGNSPNLIAYTIGDVWYVFDGSGKGSIKNWPSTKRQVEFIAEDGSSAFLVKELESGKILTEKMDLKSGNRTPISAFSPNLFAESGSNFDGSIYFARLVDLGQKAAGTFFFDCSSAPVKNIAKLPRDVGGTTLNASGNLVATVNYEEGQVQIWKFENR